MQRNCSECKFLKRTSPTQVFLLCTFWAARQIPISGTGGEYDRSYVIAHCHMQPEAPACPYFETRRVIDGATGVPLPVPCTA